MISQYWGHYFLVSSMGRGGIFPEKECLFVMVMHLYELCLPCGIDFTGKFVLLEVKFLFFELGSYHVLHVIADI